MDPTNIARNPSLIFEDALRRIKECPYPCCGGPHHFVTAEVLAPGRWLELTVRVDGRMIARSGWSLDHFSDDTLENIADWLELQASAAERRHLRVLG